MQADQPGESGQSLLYGSGGELIEFRYFGDGQRRIARKHPFEGIVANLERRYRETDSRDLARNWRSTSAIARAPNALVRA